MYPREHRNDMVQFTKNEANGEVGVGSRLSECYLTRPEGEGADDRSLLRLLVSWAQGSIVTSGISWLYWKGSTIVLLGLIYYGGSPINCAAFDRVGPGRLVYNSPLRNQYKGRLWNPTGALVLFFPKPTHRVHLTGTIPETFFAKLPAQASAL